MNNEFEQGMEYFFENINGAVFGEQISNLWVKTIKDSVDSLENNIIQLVKNNKNTGTKQLQGLVAESWHADTFNYNASKKGSFARAKMLGLNKYGSIDIKAGKRDFSSKYYKNAAGSLREQSKTPFEKYMQLKKQRGDTYKESDFLNEYKIDKKNMHKSMYLNQGKLIPTDQLLKASNLIERKIAKERALGNKEQLEKLKEIKATLTDIVKDNKGNKSIPLTREQAQKLTESAKKGKIDDELLKECGIDVNKLVSGVDILKQSLKAGISAAMISTIISMAPTILNGIEMLITKGEIDKEIIREKGFEALNPAAKSFITGSITAGLVAACKSGKLGETLINANTSIIATSVVLVVGFLEKSIECASGKITKAQLADEIAKMFTVTAFTVGSGMLASIWFVEVPPLAALAYMLGSLLGGIIGSVAYNIGKSIFMSFCVESGFTFFGIVEQNYELPRNIIDEIGIEVFEYEKFDYNKFEYDNFEFDRFNTDDMVFEYDKYGIAILRRGVLEIGKIAYI